MGDGHAFRRDHLNQKKEEEAGVLLVSHVTETHYTHTSPNQRLSLKCLLHWASGRNRSKMTAVRSIPVESEVDLYTVTPA